MTLQYLQCLEGRLKEGCQECRELAISFRAKFDVENSERGHCREGNRGRNDEGYRPNVDGRQGGGRLFEQAGDTGVPFAW